MSCLKTKKYLAVVAAVAAFLAFGTVNAATLTLEFDYSFGDPGDPDTAPPDGSGPWLTAEFVDVAPGEVELTLTVGTIGDADIDQVYFNLDPAMDATDLAFTRDGGTGPTIGETSISTGTDAFKADADGLYDILFDFDNNPQSARFQAGETLTYTIEDIDDLITVSSFNFLATPDDINGPFLAAAKVLETGSDSVFCASGNGQCSDWIAPAIIPVPAAAWLFGSALGLLGWSRRKPI